MYSHLGRIHRSVPVLLGIVTLAGVAVLVAWNIAPRIFPPQAHEYLAAFPLAMIAVAYLVYQWTQRPPFAELVKAALLALAFLLWAANQYWPTLHQAALFNDLAIALFVLDIFLVMVSRPDHRLNL
jgi:hypothetical protein